MSIKMSTTKYDQLRALVRQKRLPAYRVRQLTDAIFTQRIGEFAHMTVLPRHLRDELTETFGPTILGIRPTIKSEATQVTKVLFALPDDHRIEAVKMRYRAGWYSYCISSQSGCNLGCPFCATGKIGLNRSLTSDEITDQILYFHLYGARIDSVSFMGMGEALANPATFTAIRTLTDDRLFALSPRRITVSTVGVIPNIEQMTRNFPQVNLTFSLHSPFATQRNELVPLNRTYPLADVMDALDEHIHQTRRKVYIAYVLLNEVNDSTAHAQELGAMLQSRGAHSYLYHVNLIRYHTGAGTAMDYQRAQQSRVDRFYKTLKDANISVTMRQSFGEEINAACGQLYGQYRTARTKQC